MKHSSWTHRALTAAVVIKLVLINENMSVDCARRVRRADMVAGASAAAILVFGTLRVLYFEKGGSYYIDNLFFQVKIGLFLLAALLSIYPTTRFARWRQDLEVYQHRRGLESSLMAKGIGS